MVNPVKTPYILTETRVESKVNWLKGLEANWIGVGDNLGRV